MKERHIEIEVSVGERTTLILSEATMPTDRVVLLCHGFMSNNASSTNLELTRRLLPEGIATCRFDFDGHGTTPTLENDSSTRPLQEMLMSRCLKQVEAILDWLKAQGYVKIGLLGSSFGGLVAIHGAARRKIMALALKCPVSNYPPLWRERLGEAGMRFWKENNLLTFAGLDGRARLEYAFYEDLLQYDTYKEAATIQAPTLIVHGDADEDVPHAQSEWLFEVLKCEKVFETIEGADHPFTKEADFERMLNHLFEWFCWKLRKE